MLKANKGILAVLGAASVLGAVGVGAGIAANQHQVIEADKKFSVKKLEISVGDTVTFVNADKIKHNITIKKMKYNSGLQEPGHNVDVVFDKQGKFKVRCGVHPKMKISVVVK